MESKWRQNVADLGWSQAGWQMIARLLIGGVVSDRFAVVKLDNGQWWAFDLLPTSNPMTWIPLDGPYTWEGIQFWGPFEPD